MLEELKARVIDTARRAQRDGLCKHRSGNFSQKDDKTEYIVITPTGVDREKLVVPDMVVLDEDARVIENLTGLKPTSESLMHLSLYKTRPKIRAVAHTHSMYGTILAVLGKPIPAIVYEMLTLNCKKARIPVAEYGRPGTKALADSVVGPCREADAMLLKGHGVLAVDETCIEEAYLKVSYVEELAQIYCNALSLNGGKEPDVFPPEELQKWEYPKEIKF